MLQEPSKSQLCSQGQPAVSLPFQFSKTNEVVYCSFWGHPAQNTRNLWNNIFQHSASSLHSFSHTFLPFLCVRTHLCVSYLLKPHVGRASTPLLMHSSKMDMGKIERTSLMFQRQNPALFSSGDYAL